MDVFALRERVVEEYKGDVESFIRVLDDRIADYVRRKFADGELRPADAHPPGGLRHLHLLHLLEVRVRERFEDQHLEPHARRYRGRPGAAVKPHLSMIMSVPAIGTQALGMNPEKLLERLAAGNLRNVAFADLCRLAEALGFRLERVRGSHHVYRHREHPVRLNLQDRQGEAKPYQIRQLLAVVEDYNLNLTPARRRKPKR